MTLVSSKEFGINQEKYFDMALNEQIYVQRERDNIMFLVTTINNYNDDAADLALAKSRRNDSNRELTSVDELINHLRQGF